MVGIGTVDDHAVVEDDIPRLDDRRHFGGSILFAEVGDPLAESDDVAGSVRSHALAMRDG